MKVRLSFICLILFVGQLKAESTADLLGKLADADPKVRRMAAMNIGKEYKGKSVKNIQEASTALKKALSDTDPQVRRASGLSFEVLNSSGALPVLSGVYSKETDRSVKVEFVRLFGKHKSDISNNVLMKSVNDVDPIIRTESIYALGELNNHQSYEVITAKLSDEAEGVRVAASETCAKLKISGSAAKIVPLLGDSNTEVRLRAAKSLRIIGDTTISEQIKPYLDKEPDPEIAAILLAITQKAK